MKKTIILSVVTTLSLLAVDKPTIMPALDIGAGLNKTCDKGVSNPDSSSQAQKDFEEQRRIQTEKMKAYIKTHPEVVTADKAMMYLQKLTSNDWYLCQPFPVTGKIECIAKELQLTDDSQAKEMVFFLDKKVNNKLSIKEWDSIQSGLEKLKECKAFFVAESKYLKTDQTKESYAKSDLALIVSTEKNIQKKCIMSVAQDEKIFEKFTSEIDKILLRGVSGKINSSNYSFESLEISKNGNQTKVKIQGYSSKNVDMDVALTEVLFSKSYRYVKTTQAKKIKMIPLILNNIKKAGHLVRNMEYVTISITDKNIGKLIEVKTSKGIKISIESGMGEQRELSEVAASLILKGKKEEAINVYKKGCDELQEKNSCRELSGIYMQDRENKVSQKLSLKYGIKSCELGDGILCHYIGEYYEKEKNIQLAKMYLNKACGQYMKGSCDKLKEMK